MDTLLININDRDILFEEEKQLINYLKEDDDYLIDYVNRAAANGLLVQYGIIPEDVTTGNLRITRYTEKAVDVNKENIEVPETKKKKTFFKSKEWIKYMLNLRAEEDYIKKFNDKKHHKMQLWGEICQKMKSNGMDVGDGSEGAERCRQKFANLQKTYIEHVKDQKQTGAGFVEAPEFYEEMHRILGQKDKIYPKYVLSSMEVSSLTQEPSATPSRTNNLNIPLSTSYEDPSPSTSYAVNSAEESVEELQLTENTSTNSTTISTLKKHKYKKFIRPKKETNLDKILTVVNDMNKECSTKYEKIIKLQEQHNTEIKEYLVKNDENQKQFLNLFGTLVDNIKKKKRKRHSSSSDE